MIVNADDKQQHPMTATTCIRSDLGCDKQVETRAMTAGLAWQGRARRRRKRAGA